MRRRFSLSGAGFVFGIVAFFFFLPLLVNAGTKSIEQNVSKMSPQVFVTTLAPEAQRLGKAYGIKPSVLIAQAAIETNYGRRLLGHKYHNLYTLRASGRRQRVWLKTTVTKDGKSRQVKQDYQVYSSWSASLADYLVRLKSGRLVSKVFYEQLATATSYQEASQVFYQEGYTTDGEYAGQLVKIIEQYKLDKYDQ